MVTMPPEHPAPVMRILLAVDGSSRSDGAARFALWLAGRGAKVEVVTVAELPMEYRTGYPYPLPRREEIQRRTHDHLERVRLQLRRVGFRHVPKIHLGIEAPVRWIAKHAGNTDLVVLGKSTRNPLERLLSDDVPANVARLSPVPVLAVPKPTEIPFIRALAGIDFADASLRAAHRAASLLAPGGTLHLVHVRGAAAADDGDGPDPGARAARERLSELAAELTAAHAIETTAEVRLGPIEPSLLRAAEEVDAQMIALGSHGHGFVDRLLLGSTTMKLLRAAPCAVLVEPMAEGEAG